MLEDPTYYTDDETGWRLRCWLKTKYNLDPDDVINNWRYCGALAEDHRIFYFDLCFPDMDFPKPKGKCVCHAFLFTKNYYITNGTDILILCKYCLDHHIKHNKRTCEICLKPHRNILINACNECKKSYDKECESCKVIIHNSAKYCSVCNHFNKTVTTYIKYTHDIILKNKNKDLIIFG